MRRAVGVGRACFVAGVEAGERRAGIDLGAEAEQPVEADGVIDPVGRHAAAAAQRHHGHADAARVDAADDALARREDVADDRRRRQMLVHVLDEIGRAAEQRHHAARSARWRVPDRARPRTACAGVAAQSRSARAPPAQSASVTSSRRGSRCAPVRKSTALRISSALPAALASGSFMSVISAAVLVPAPLATVDEALRQLARLVERRHEGAGAGLHVEDQRAEPGGELLATGSTR